MIDQFANNSKTSFEIKLETAGEMIKFFENKLSTKESRTRFGMPSYLYMWKEPINIDTDEVMKAFKSK